MKLSFTTIALTVTVSCVAASSAFAAPSGCSSAPASQWQPKSKLESQLTAKGMKVRQIKAERGCYEVYATDKSGKRQNLAFNAQTLKQLADAEAGEK
jgi:hypothetical protein